ncbi:MAG: hypothetical protein OCC49_06565 [Fibrobacterales bacterium]
MQRSNKNTRKGTGGRTNKPDQSSERVNTNSRGRIKLTRQQKAEGVKVSALKPSKSIFETILAKNLQEGGKKYLSGYTYSESADLVNQTIKEFWKDQKVPGKCLKLIESKPHNGWRGDCTLKVSGKGAQLKYDIPKELTRLEQVDEASQQLFDSVIIQLSKPHLVSLQNHISAITIRTLSDERKVVIYQVSDTTKRAIQNLKSVDQFLEREVDFYAGCYALITGSGKACTFDEPLPLGYKFKKISGGDTITVGPQQLEIHPFEFYRSNRGIISSMDQKVAEMLKPQKTGEEHFIDLFSGSSHWTFLAGADYKKCWSVDIKKMARESFTANSAIKKRKNGSIIIDKIDSEFLKRFIPDENEIPATLMIDSPSAQLPSGILRSIADKKVKRVVQVFNDINMIPEEIRKWRKHGYILKKIIPFDSKPFSGQPECIALLNIDYLGLLDKNQPKKKKQIKSTPAANTSGIRFVQN